MARRVLSIAIPEFNDIYPTLDVLPAQRQLLDALHEFGYESQVVPPNAKAKQIWRRVSTFLKNGKPSDTLIVHILSHGEVLNDQLLVVDADGEYGSNTSVDGWMLDAAERDGELDTKPLTLFIVDLCGAGAVARRQWDGQLDDGGRRVWVIAATRPDQPAYDGRLTTAVARVLSKTANNGLDLHESVAELPFGTFAQEVRAAVREMSHAYPQDVISTRIDPASGVPEPTFFPNPALPRSHEALPFDPWHFLSRAAAGRRPEEADLAGRANRFFGRESQVRRLSVWMDDEPDSRLCVVTGKPGVGKSSLLGFLVCATHPDLRYIRSRGYLPFHNYPGALPRERTRMAAVNVRDRRLQAILRSLAQQLALDIVDTPDWDASRFLNGLKALGTQLGAAEPPLIVLDALDEAGNADDLVENLLLPLLEADRADGQPVARLLIGTRHVQAVRRVSVLAERERTLVDLDWTPSETLRTDLTNYVLSYLGELLGSRSWVPGPRKTVAAQLAGRLTESPRGGRTPVTGEFLIATMFVGALARMAPQEAVRESNKPPTDVLELFDFDMQQRRADGAKLTALLEVLAFARGYGMPRRMLVGGGLPGIADDLTENEVDRLLDLGSFYLTRNVDRDGTTLYRIFHRELATKLRERVDGRDDSAQGTQRYEQALVRKILSLVPPSLSGHGGHWNLAPAYLLRHSLEHAAAANATDSFMTDAWFLVRADPVGVAAFLRASRASRVLAKPDRPGTRADRMAEVYRTSLGRHATMASADRRDVLTIDALRLGFKDVADDLAAAVDQSGLRWWPLWASNAEISPALMHVVSGSFGQRPLLAVTRIGNERMVLAADGPTITVWSLDRGDGTPSVLTTGRQPRIRALTATPIDLEPTVIAADEAGDLYLWQRRNGAPRRVSVSGRPATALTTAVRDDRPVALVGCENNEIYIVDLRSGLQSGVLRGIRTRPTAITVIAGHAGRSTLVAASGPPVSTISLWNLDDATPAGTLGGHQGGTSALARVERLGRQWLVSGGQDRTIKLWDPWQPKIQGTTLRLATEIPAMSAADGDGESKVIVANDLAARVYDVARWGELTGVLPGHGRQVRAVSHFDGPDGCTVATGSADQIRIWNLGMAVSGRRHTDRVTAIAIGTGPDGDIVVSGASDGGMRRWRWTDGAPDELPAHPYAIRWLTAITSPSNTTYVISCDVDGGISRLDLTTGRSTRLKDLSRIRGEAFARIEHPNGPAVVIACQDRTLQRWDPFTNELTTIGDHIKPILMAPVKGHPEGAIVLVSEGPQGRAQIALRNPESGLAIREFTLSEFPTALGGAVLNDEPTAAFGFFDGRCELWTFDGVRRTVLRGKPRSIGVIEWCPMPDGSVRLLTGAEDATVRMWHTESRAMEKVICFPHAVRALATHDDGLLAVGFGWEVCALADGRHSPAQRARSLT